MSVEIKIFGETAKDVLHELRDLSALVSDIRDTGAKSVTVISAGHGDKPLGDSDGGTDTGEPTTAPKRERGQPSPGKARRTKAEIAEDDAAGQYIPQETVERDAAAISDGPSDTAEDAAQDAADEAAEVDANRDSDAPLTVDDLKDVMGDYVSKFTMEATKEDGPRIFNDALGRPPEGEAAWKASLIAGLGQDHLRKAIAAWKSAAASEDRYQKGA